MRSVTDIELAVSAELKMKWIRSNSSTGELFEYDDGLPYPPNICLCPCCGFKTLPRRNWFEVCPVCDWEDDGQGDQNDGMHNAWNHMVSLRNARRNFIRFGASMKRRKKYTRSPLPEEIEGAHSYAESSSRYDFRPLAERQPAREY